MHLIELHPPRPKPLETGGSQPRQLSDALLVFNIAQQLENPVEKVQIDEVCNPQFEQNMRKAVTAFELFPKTDQHRILQQILECPSGSLSQIVAMRRFVKACFFHSVATDEDNYKPEQKARIAICCGHTSLSFAAVHSDPFADIPVLPLDFNPAKRENWLLTKYQSIEEVMGVFLAHMTQVVRALYFEGKELVILSGGPVRIDAMSGEEASLSEAQSYHTVIRDFILPALFPSNPGVQQRILDQILLHPTARSTAENMLSVAMVEDSLSLGSGNPPVVDVITWGFKTADVNGGYADGVNELRRRKGLPPVAFRAKGIGNLAALNEREAAAADSNQRVIDFLQTVYREGDLSALTANRETDRHHTLIEAQLFNQSQAIFEVAAD